MGSNSQVRLSKLSESLSAASIDVFLAWSPISMGYLADFFEYGHERFLTLMVHRSGEVALIAPSLSAAQARRMGIQNVIPWSDGEKPLAHFEKVMREWGATTLAIDPEMPAHMVLSIQNALPGAKFVNGHSIISSLRAVKSTDELEKMRAASRIVDEVFPIACAAIKPGVSELEISDVLASEMKKRGGTPTFSIVAAGANAAEPHHLSDHSLIQANQVVLMDFGCELDHYQSDVTRTVCCGTASDELKHVYRTVHQAFLAGFAAVRPGVPPEDVDRAARSVIEAVGYGEAFFHRLGHGIGMQGHEEPNLVAGNTKPLEVGNCFSIEPGIYLEGNLGVRIENLATVTADGVESFNGMPPSEILEI